MTTFWWVRHGPTHQTAFTGWRDVPADLSDAAALERLNAALPPGALVISSDLIRAVATADALTGGRRRLPHDPRLREFDFGEWDGLTFDEVARREPELSERYWSEPGTAAPPGGESWNDAAARVGTAVAALAGAHPGADIVAVAHIGVILTQLGAARGEPPSTTIAQHIRPLSLTRIRPDDPAGIGPVDHCP